MTVDVIFYFPHLLPELKALEEHPAFDDMDAEVLEMLLVFNELSEVDQERVIEQLDGLLSEKV